jgi:hypothetical protein
MAREAAELQTASISKICGGAEVKSQVFSSSALAQDTTTITRVERLRLRSQVRRYKSSRHQIKFDRPFLLAGISSPVRVSVRVE